MSNEQMLHMANWINTLSARMEIYILFDVATCDGNFNKTEISSATTGKAPKDHKSGDIVSRSEVAFRISS